MEKIDYKKQLKNLYKPSARKVDIVKIPQMNFLMIDGEGDPNTSQSFQDAIDVLHPLSYALKFMVKRGELEIYYSVMPLEGLWWADDMSSFSAQNKENWQWTLMIMQPDFIAKEMVENAREEVRKKKNLVALQSIRFESFSEGKAAQIMHIGPFSEEGPTIAKLHSFIEENNSRRIGKHHELYLSDIRRAAPEKWKTIIRQPMS